MNNNNNGKNFQKKNPKKVKQNLAKLDYCHYCFFPTKNRKLIKCEICKNTFCHDCLMEIDDNFLCPDCFFKWSKDNIKFAVTK